MKQERMSADEYRKGSFANEGKFKAKRCKMDGFVFASQLQMAVYVRLKNELRKSEKLVLDARFPLVSDVAWRGRAGYISIDFSVWRIDSGVWTIQRVIDAKPKAREAVSRDWPRGARAFHATYGIKIEEVSS